jgi:alpha-glucosidase (family GH31 glycosyl hydrolase)
VTRAHAPPQVEQYHSLIGFPVMPPLWALGFHQCRWGYEDLQAVIDVADGYQVRACLLLWVGTW